MSTSDDGQQNQQQQKQQQHNHQEQQHQQTLSPQPDLPPTLLNITNEESSTKTSIMGKVKLRVASIIPNLVTNWFSPSSGTADAPHDEEQQSPQQQQPQQNQQQQHNGSALSSQGKDKHVRRRIQLEADDAPDTVDDGTDAQDLNDEEVQLADNIAEHDLAAEDEQTRRSEYNVSMLRKRQLAARDNDDDEEDDEDVEDEDDDEPDDDAQNNYQQLHPQRNAAPFRMLKVNSSSSNASQPLQKRKRLELAETTFSPQLGTQRRRPQLHASTPAVGDPLRSHAPPNRLKHMNLYGQQRVREPAYNFMAAGSISEAAVATSGDLPMSSRRTLNIPPMTERRETSLPNYKRQSLLGKRESKRNKHTFSNRLESINEMSNNDEQHQHASQQTIFPSQETNNNNNNNNNIISAKRDGDGGAAAAAAAGTDSHSECESTESNAGGTIGQRRHNNNNNNSSNNNNNISYNNNLLFYSHLNSPKSLFNSSPSHHNSTLSLNSLNERRRFNASIYGSMSALSDSRLLSSKHSTTSASSPFYNGPTVFGGSSANNRYFSQGNLASNSGGSSPAPSNSDIIRRTRFNYGMKPVDMRPKSSLSASGDGSGNNSNIINNISSGPGLSVTAQRILRLLENHSTPLMDVQRLGSTLREDKMNRTIRDAAAKPYSYPSAYNFNNSSSNRMSSFEVAEKEAEEAKRKLLVPTMLQLLESRRLHRISPSARQLINAQQQKLQQSAAAGSLSHTNKMRSRLLHQTRKNARSVDEQLPPPSIDLPDIRFPTMASQPKFDFVIEPPPKPATTTTTAQIARPAFVQMTNFNSSKSNNATFASAAAANNGQQKQTQKQTNSSQIYQFEMPVELNSSGLAKAAARVKRNFNFAPPLHLDQLAREKENDDHNDDEEYEELQPPQPPPKRKLLPTPNAAFNGANSASNIHNSLKESGSMGDLLPAKPSTPTSVGFGDRFKKSASEWECDACMLRNKLEASECVACGTARLKANAATVPKAAASLPLISSGGFGDCFKQPSNNWECDACMLFNKAEASKCIACETPRKIKTATSSSCISLCSSNSSGTSGSGSRSGSSSDSSSISASNSNSNSFPAAVVGFGDAFKPKSNTWECGTCLIMNQTSSAECIACQTPNPKAAKPNPKPNPNPVANISSSFKFGFTPAAAVQPKADAGFQQLIAAQKSSSWNCEACLAQNDMTRDKCICCEELKPGSSTHGSSTVPTFMFGASSGSKIAAVAPSKSAPAAPAAATTSQFKFGFAAAAAGNDVADNSTKPATLTTSTVNTSAITGFKFGAVEPAKTVSFKLSTEPQQQQEKLQPAEIADTTAPASSKAPATSSIGISLFAVPATAATTTTKATTNTTAMFAFGASSGSGTTTTTTTTAKNNLFSFGAFSTPSTVASFTSVSSSNTSSSTTSSSTTTTTTNSLKSATGIFNFGGSGSSSSISQPPAAPISLMFAQPTPIVPAAAPDAPASFVFGSQPPAAAAAPAVITTASSNSFFFGPTPTTTTTAASAPAASPALTSNPPGNVSIFGSVATNKSPSSTAVSTTGATPSTAPIFSFGSSSSGGTSINSSSGTFGSSAFSFGAKTAAGQPGETAATTCSSTTSTTAISSFGWPTASVAAAAPPTSTIAASTALPIFGNGSSSGLFGGLSNTMTTNATQPLAASSPFSMAPAAAQPITGGGGGINAGVGLSVGVGVSSVFGNVNNPFGGGSNNTAPTAPITTAKPAFNFGSAVAASAAPAAGVFNFNATTSNTPKPAFNFTAAPQTSAFNFSGNTTAAAPTGGSDSTPNTAPFQFNAGASAPANIFAFNPPNAGNNMQNPRRKTRGPVRRQPPR